MNGLTASLCSKDPRTCPQKPPAQTTTTSSPRFFTQRPKTRIMRFGLSWPVEPRGIDSASVARMRLHPLLTRGRDMRTQRSPTSILLPWCALVLSACCALAQSPGPQPLPMPAPIAAPKDTPYPAIIRLNVDATDIERHIFGVRETIPVRAGEPVVILSPQWLPGNTSSS